MGNKMLIVVNVVESKGEGDDKKTKIELVDAFGDKRYIWIKNNEHRQICLEIKE